MLEKSDMPSPNQVSSSLLARRPVLAPPRHIWGGKEAEVLVNFQHESQIGIHENFRRRKAATDHALVGIRIDVFVKLRATSCKVRRIRNRARNTWLGNVGSVGSLAYRHVAI